MIHFKFYLTAAFFFFLILVNPPLSRADSSYDTSAQGQDEKTVSVNQQLDMVESSQPESKSTGSLLKEVLSPDLSENTQPKPPSNVNTRVHTWDMGAEVFYYRYQEPQPVGIKMQGPMYGYFAGYSYRPADPNFFNNFLTNVYMVQARYASSHDLEYSGDGVIKGKHDESMEFRGLIGKDYFIGMDTRVTPYFGFGYRYLVDYGNGESSLPGVYAYDRKAHYYYLPMGGNAAINMPNNWEVDLNAEYDILLQGFQKSYLSDVDRFTGDNFTDITNRQDHGYGVRGSIRFLKHGTVVDFYVEPYIRFWHIADSKTNTELVDGQLLYGTEPDNNTIEVGTRAGIQF